MQFMLEMGSISASEPNMGRPQTVGNANNSNSNTYSNQGRTPTTGKGGGGNGGGGGPGAGEEGAYVMNGGFKMSRPSTGGQGGQPMPLTSKSTSQLPPLNPEALQ